MSKFEFLFSLNGVPVFERDRKYYSDKLATNDVAFGMTTDDVEGMAQIETIIEINLIKSLIEKNKRLEKISIVGLKDETIMIAVEISGEYRYFSLKGFTLNDITDDLIEKLPNLETCDGGLEFSEPIIINK